MSNRPNSDPTGQQKDLPKYAELKTLGPSGRRYAWDVFSDHDQLGTINLLTPERVRRAAGLVRRGKVFNLCLPLNQPDPHVTETRRPFERKEEVIGSNFLDDKLDNLYVQYSTHWDALSHVRSSSGFYGGWQNEDVAKGKLGIDKWAEHGIVGRGILLDISRYMEKHGAHPRFDEEWTIKAAGLQATAREQRVDFEVGDILLIRTGWMKYYYDLDPAGKKAFVQGPGSKHFSSGLEGSVEMAAFLWDSRVAAVAADNPAVERITSIKSSLHMLALCLLGMPLGELWDLETLAEDCAQDGVYEFQFVSAPLNAPTFGSPANAVAIK